MQANVAIVIAIAILSTTAFALIAFIASRKRQAKEEELRREASSRGWKFEGSSSRGYRVHTWSGTTDGVSWRAESLLGREQGRGRATAVTRYRTRAY